MIYWGHVRECHGCGYERVGEIFVNCNVFRLVVGYTNLEM